MRYRPPPQGAGPARREETGFDLGPPHPDNRAAMGCTGCSLGSSANPGGNYVGVRLGDSEDGKTTLVFMGEVAVKKGERIIVETDGGPEFAEVLTTSPLAAKACSTRKAKRFLRLASDSEYADFVDRQELQDRAFRFVDERIAARKLEMRLPLCSRPVT